MKTAMHHAEQFAFVFDKPAPAPRKTCPIRIPRLGVNKEHVVEYDLPTRPPKGSRRGETVEWAVDIDAMKPAIIRQLLTDRIEQLVDSDQLQRLKTIEESERETIRNLAFL